MVFRELLRSCPSGVPSSVDLRREWFLEELTKLKLMEITGYLRPIAIASKPREQPSAQPPLLGPVLTEEQWRGVMLTVDPKADAEDVRQTLVDLGFPAPPEARGSVSKRTTMKPSGGTGDRYAKTKEWAR